jgi:hypothetical protein
MHPLHAEDAVMREHLDFYIDGQWVKPAVPKTLDVINPTTEEVVGRISLGSAADVDRAVAAARKAFETFSRTKAKSIDAYLPPFQLSDSLAGCFAGLSTRVFGLINNPPSCTFTSR